MRLFLGNSTKQHFDFHYRLPEDDPKAVHRRLTIPVGTQICLPGEHSREVLESIIGPSLRYGWMESNAISRAKTFVGLLYSFDKPITENALSYVIEANDGKLDDMALEEYKRAAVAASKMGADENVWGEKPRQFDAEVHQIDATGRKTSPLVKAEVRNAAPVPKSGRRKVA